MSSKQDFRVDITRTAVNINRSNFRYEARIYRDSDDRLVATVKADYNYLLLRKVRKSIKKFKKEEAVVANPNRTVKVRL